MSRIVADTRGRKSGPSTAIARSQYGAVLRPLAGQVLYLGKKLDIADHTCYDAGEVAKELGATVVRSWGEDVTHAIVPREDYCRGTATVVSAIKARIPIVRALWLVECDRLQKSVALNKHEWETVLDEEERLEAARESYLAAQRKHDTAESSGQSSRPGRADDAHDGSLGPGRPKRGGKGKEKDEKLEDRGFKVYVDPESGAMYDATLNLTNAGKNNNKYYIMQVGQSAEKPWINSGGLTQSQLATAQARDRRLLQEDALGKGWPCRTDGPAWRRNARGRHQTLPNQVQGEDGS